MMFRPHLADLVIAGEKTVTRRACSANRRSPWWVERCSLVVGRRYAIQPGRGKTRIGTAEVASVVFAPLGNLSIEEARAEGFAWPAEFEATFAALNGGVYDPDLAVWVVGLRDARPS